MAEKNRGSREISREVMASTSSSLSVKRSRNSNTIDFRVSTPCLGYGAHEHNSPDEIEHLPLVSQGLCLLEQRPACFFRQLELSLSIVTMLSHLRHEILQVVQFLVIQDNVV